LGDGWEVTEKGVEYMECTIRTDGRPADWETGCAHLPGRPVRQPKTATFEPEGAAWEQWDANLLANCRLVRGEPRQALLRLGRVESGIAAGVHTRGVAEVRRFYVAPEAQYQAFGAGR